MTAIRMALVLLFLSSPVLRAEAPANAEYETAPPVTGSYLGEAAGAVVGRVFGVEGDASDIKYHEIELTAHSPASAATRSAFIPGWGQHFNNQKAKGTVFFFVTVGALAGTVHLASKADRTYDDYKQLGVKNSSLYDDYKSEQTRAIALGSVTAVLWTIGVIDAYRHAYVPLYSKTTSFDVAFIDGGAEMSVRKKF